MTAASVACALAVRAAAGPGTTVAVALGTVGPLAAALAGVSIVGRVHAKAPERVSGVMIKLFGAKLVLFAAYVAAAVLLLSAGTAAFVASFTCQYVLLHVLQAHYLRRLFAGGGRSWSVG